jgi:4-hydroxybenzoate polyprenyltransferase/phosphoserine phosphatase
MDPIPLCVDLDGTLILTDVLQESLVLALKRRPWLLILLPLWLGRGRAHMKRKLAGHIAPDVATLPLNRPLVEYLRKQREAGRRLILVTAADRQIADRVAEHTGLFSEVMASEGTINLAGVNKGDALARRFGSRQFDYAGNEGRDLQVWSQARRAIVVGPGRLARRAAEVCEVERTITPPGPGFGPWRRALRVHQWAKNLLLFVPLLGAHAWSDGARLRPTLLAFVVFCLGASSVYILNDLLDLESDRHHGSKRFRPFATGEIPIPLGGAALGLLFVLAVALALFCLPLSFTAVFAGYYLLTLLYSGLLKRLALVDVFVLAGLYGVRILAGGAASRVEVSQWLLAFSVFVFFSLAFAKRYIELAAVTGGERVRGRGYQPGDAAVVSSMGIASGYIAVLVLALYINSPVVTDLYHRPELLWLGCVVIFYWISRVWLLAHRGSLHEDPIIFAIKDPESWAAAASLLIIGWAAAPK